MGRISKNRSVPKRAVQTVTDPEYFRRRWTCDPVNAVVSALNAGRSLQPLLEKILGRSKSKTDSGRFDLRGIDLSHQNLRGPWRFEENRRFRTGVDLRKTDFTGANFEWTILPRADMRGSVLVQGDFRNAELLFTDFTGADLTGVRLEGAWVHQAIFPKAVVSPEQMALVRRTGPWEEPDDQD